MLDERDQRLLRLAIAVSVRSRGRGNHPFGAVLADEDGEVLLEAENTVVSTGDVTGHAETNLVRTASSTLPLEVLARATVYSSTEPCAMCAGAIYWSGVGRLVYAMAETDLLALTGTIRGTPRWTSAVASSSVRAALGRGRRAGDGTGSDRGPRGLLGQVGRRGMTDPSDHARTLEVAIELASEYLRGLSGRHVGPRADAVEIMAALGRDLADEGIAPDTVIRQMAEAVEPGLVASSGPRYFGFVFGGALPASIGADWLAATWDQNAVLHAASPAAAAVEQVAGEWVLDLLGLPMDAGFGLRGVPVSPTWSPSRLPAMPCLPGRTGMSRLVVSTGPRRSRWSSGLKRMPRWSQPSSTSASGVSGSCGCRPTSRDACAATHSVRSSRAFRARSSPAARQGT